MSKKPGCPACGAPLDPTRDRCPYCGHLTGWSEAQQRALEAYTQGIAREGYSNGDYEETVYPALPLSQALQILQRMPVPPQLPPEADYCPPALGFDNRQISRMPNGDYFLWPENRTCDYEEARHVLLQIYGVNA